MDVLSEDPRFDEFLTALAYTRLDEQLRMLDADDVTVFAPTNEAFRSAPAQLVERLYTPGNEDVFQSKTIATHAQTSFEIQSRDFRFLHFQIYSSIT